MKRKQTKRKTKKPSFKRASRRDSGFLDCSGGRIRTCDLRVMSPTSYQTALPRDHFNQNFVAETYIYKPLSATLLNANSF